MDELKKKEYEPTDLVINHIKDLDALRSTNGKKYDRLYILVDSAISAILKHDGQLKTDAFQIMKELEETGTHIFPVDMFPPDDEGDDFREVFYQLPSNVRKRLKRTPPDDLPLPRKKQAVSAESPGTKNHPVEYSMTATLTPSPDQPQMAIHNYTLKVEGGEVASTQIGCGNEANIKLSDQEVNILQMGPDNTIKIYPQANTQIVISINTSQVPYDVVETVVQMMNENHADIQGVSSYTVTTGSIVIRLEVEPGQIVTKAWLDTVIKTLFSPDVCKILPNDITMDIEINGSGSLRREEVAKPECSTAAWTSRLDMDQWTDTSSISSGFFSVDKWSDTSSISSGYHTDTSALEVLDTADDLKQSPSEKPIILGSSKQECSTCTKVDQKYKSRKLKECVFTIHVDRNIPTLRPRGGRKQRRFISDTMQKYVSALLNTKGGHILVHLHGQQPKDKNLEFFDEFITAPLSSLLSDSQMYTDMYRRYWLENDPEFSTFQDFIVFSVGESQMLATADFNTKCRNDFENVSPSSWLVLSILSQTVQDYQQPRLIGLSEDGMHNDRGKLVCPCNENYLHDSLTVLVEHIWSDMGLKYTISSMSKMQGQTSFFFGVKEETRKYKSGYITKRFRPTGFVMPFAEEEFKNEMNNKLATDTCALDKATMTFDDVPRDLIDIAFHPVPGGPSDRVVMEVAVGYFDGIVFYDKEGPRTYKLENGKVCRMEKTEWLERLRDVPEFTLPGSPQEMEINPVI